MRRKSSLAAARKIAAQNGSDASLGSSDNQDDYAPAANRARARSRRNASRGDDDDEHKPEPEPEPSNDEDGVIEQPKAKRRKTTSSTTKRAGGASVFQDLLTSSSPVSPSPALPPLRHHSPSYHIPLLLSGPSSREARSSLLSWFDSVSTTRRMPWRKPWIDPRSSLFGPNQDASVLREALERRAYEVWISEIMLQQTRVAVVIDYWNRWMARWPTIQDLAAASPEDVLSAWRGLGYYSRATRIHEAAKLVVADELMRGLLPANVAELEKKVPGVGRYTAGAISAIVFGRAAPMVDGNVLRVLSRQLGVLGNVKTDKSTVDFLWAAADALVQAVAADLPSEDGSGPDSTSTEQHKGESTDAFESDRPGRWGQALMELGSTVCTPKPNCAQCPITSTCRAYAEGRALALGPKAAKAKPGRAVEDMEDACTTCEPLEQAAGDGEGEGDLDAADVDASKKNGDKSTARTKTVAKKQGSSKQATLSAFRFTRAAVNGSPRAADNEKSNETQVGVSTEIISDHARKFPLKVVKKAVRQEETVVCAVRRHDGRYLIHKRPAKGLLAGMWELPSHVLPDGKETPAKERVQLANKWILGLTGEEKPKLKHDGELGSVPWLFSHLKLTMHVHSFELAGVQGGEGVISTSHQRWATADEIDEESMGTGMRHCWALVKDAVD